MLPGPRFKPWWKNGGSLLEGYTIESTDEDEANGLTEDKTKMANRHGQDISLREAVFLRMQDLEKSINHRFEALMNSIEIVRQELDKRLKAIEDIRAQMQEQQGKFAARDNVQFMFDSLDKKL